MPVKENGTATCDVCFKVHHRKVYDVDGEIVSYCFAHDKFKEKKCTECGDTFKPQARFAQGTIMCTKCRVTYLRKRNKYSSAFI